jgi:hypothetical protein
MSGPVFPFFFILQKIFPGVMQADQQLDVLLQIQYLLARNYGKNLSQLRVSRAG